MATKYIRGYSEKQIYRNEYFNKGTISTNDPLSEGSFRRLINFNVSNQNASLKNREPFLTVPLYSLSNKRIALSKNAFVFTLNDSTEYAYILDLKEGVVKTSAQVNYLKRDISLGKDIYVVDGDTINIDGQRYRLAIIDAPELNDKNYKPIGEEASNFEDMGSQAKEFVENELRNKQFSIFQADFQSDLIDEFGRPLVFIEYKGGEEDEEGNQETKLLNVELVREGLATVYGHSNFKQTSVDYYIQNQINLDNGAFRLYKSFESAFRKDISGAAYSSLYNNAKLNILDIAQVANTKYEKPVIHKITKSTDLKKTENGTLIKRVLKTFEINELQVKSDLEIAVDLSLRYTLESNDLTVVNGKYQDQYINFIVNVTDPFGKSIYKGLVELTHSNENLEGGIEESFKLKTYNKPEAHIEIQDLTNVKPNILDKQSIIPKTMIEDFSNVQGYTSPSVDTVLVQADFNYNLELNIDKSEKRITKFFNTNSLNKDHMDLYNIVPYYKAPTLHTGKKVNYMYRWDLVNLKELDLGNKEEIKNAEPFFRSAWTKLNTNIKNEENNISQNPERLKEISMSINQLRTADEYYIITLKDKVKTIDDEEDADFEIEDLSDGASTIKDFTESFNLFLKDNSTNYIKRALESNNITILVKADNVKVLKELDIIKVKNISDLSLILNRNEEEDSIEFNESEKSKVLSKEERVELFEKENKKIAFIFMPFEVKFPDGKRKAESVFYALETKGIVFDNSSDRKKMLPLNLNIGEIKKELPEGFLDNGIQATFYLTTYESAEELTEPDEFYDVLAYKRSSATYTFKEISKNKYEPSDFIEDRLVRESEAIQNSKYLTKFEDKIIAYGSPGFSNSIFISEDGAPYYFSLSSVYEFDHEVVHVQTFKNIILVFTINDIWVIYPVEVDASFQDQEGNRVEQKRLEYRYKKILYNISTEVKNKSTIKNITRYITLMSNDVLYLITPSTFIADDTEFSLNILSKNIDAIVKDPLKFINERLKYYDIFEFAKDYKLNLNATDNYIKLYYSTVVQDKTYTLILTYDILNRRWFEEDTISFGYPKSFHFIDSTTKYEMLTEKNDELLITYQTDKYNNLNTNRFGESYFDINENNKFPIKYYLDTGYLKLNEHLMKRFRSLLYTMKNIDSRKILFTYNFTIDDKQFESNFEPTYTVNQNNEIMEILKEKQAITSDIAILLKMKEQLTASDRTELDKIIEYSKSEVGTLNDFRLDFSNLEIGDIITVKQPLLGRGRLPRIQMGFTASNRFYVLSYGIIYSEHGGKSV